MQTMVDRTSSVRKRMALLLDTSDEQTQEPTAVVNS